MNIIYNICIITMLNIMKYALIIFNVCNNNTVTFSILWDLTGPAKKYFYDNVNSGRRRDNGIYLYMTQTFVKVKMMFRKKISRVPASPPPPRFELS